MGNSRAEMETRRLTLDYAARGTGPCGDPSEQSFCGRVVSASEIKLIQRITTDFPGLSVTEICRTICELLEWRRPSGKLKDYECRRFLESLERISLVVLPALKGTGPRGPHRIFQGADSDPKAEISDSCRTLEPIGLELLQPGAAASLASVQWREYLARYHYLGCRVPVGANLRYVVRSSKYPDQILACLLWSSPAWKIAVRDYWIGWSAEQRVKNLQLIVNNSRFLMLPWVRVPGLASKILSLCARQLPEDWEAQYGCRPILFETFVDATRFRGTCYRGANWIPLGQTQGRGRMDADFTHKRTPKTIYVYALCSHVQQRLCCTAGRNASRVLPGLKIEG
jgi:hypothetical protein